MLHGLREYRGEPHRVEPVASVGGVEAFDDSKGTNVGATVAALDGLGAERRRRKLVVILGGDGKGQDFAPLAAPVARHARAVALIGRDAALIEAALAGTRRAAAAPRQRCEAAIALVLRAGPARRRGAAEPGLRQPGHVPQLRPPRRGLRRRGAARSRPSAARCWHDGRAAAPRPARAGARWRCAAAGRAAARRAAGARPGAAVTAAADAQLRGFDRPLVWVVVALLALGPGDGLFGLGRAARQPEVRALRADPLPDAPCAVAGASAFVAALLALQVPVGAVGEVRAVAASSPRCCCWCWC